MVLRKYIGHKPKDSGTRVVDLLIELKDVIGQLKRIHDKAEELISRVEEALKHPVHNTLHMSGKLVRWADSTGTYGPNDENRRPRKRARIKSLD